MNQATPGPWITRLPETQISPSAACDRMVFGTAFDGSQKAIVDRVRGNTPEQADANARLIAAAPDLLAACKAACGWYGLDGDHISEPVRSALYAAIAKAEAL